MRLRELSCHSSLQTAAEDSLHCLLTKKEKIDNLCIHLLTSPITANRYTVCITRAALLAARTNHRSTLHEKMS
jgi:hypothetical protein